MQRIPLTQNKFALVDDDDYGRFRHLRWCYRADRDRAAGCAVRHVRTEGKSRLSYLHREVMDAPAGLCVVFLNHDSLDCRRDNLRVVNRRDACRFHRVRRDSKSGVKGIKHNARHDTWSARITRDGIYHHLGSFKTKEAALEAYRHAEGGLTPRADVACSVRPNIYGINNLYMDQVGSNTPWR
jgi:hypothetical protein